MKTDTFLESFTDSRFGPVVYVRNPPKSKGTERISPHLKLATAIMAPNISLFGIRANDWGFGADFNDPAAAECAAVGEVIERYCGNILMQDASIKSSQDELKKLGENYLDIKQMIHFTKSQYERAGFPFKPPTITSKVTWIRGMSLIDEKSILVPAQLSLLNEEYFSQNDEEQHLPIQFSGISFHTDKMVACKKSFLEVCERDSVIRWWFSQDPPILVDINSLSVSVQKLLNDLKEDYFSVKVLLIPSRFYIITVGVFVQCNKNETVCFGTAADFILDAAVRKAIIEALQLQVFSLDLLDPDSSYWSSVKEKIKGKEHWKYHSDRRYLDEAKDTWKEVIDFPRHALVWLDPRMNKYAEKFYCRDNELIKFEEYMKKAVFSFDSLLNKLKEFNYLGIILDVTSDDISSIGGNVIRALIPGACPNYPACFPPLNLLRGISGIFFDKIITGYVPLPTI